MARMKAPQSGVTVRMYRQGHGDCFLLCFAPETGGSAPTFMMIDCGNKPGSQIEQGGKRVETDDVVKSIREACGGRLDIVVITHEHQDHVNLLGKFKTFDIGQVWFAWTEDPADKDARELRRRHGLKLHGLLKARQALSQRLGALDDPHLLDGIDELLALELEDGETGEASATTVENAIRSLEAGEDPFGLAGDGQVFGISNKAALDTIRSRATDGLRFFSPHQEPVEVPGSPGILAYTLGPPRDPDLLEDEDPKGDEKFGHFLGRSLSFFGAASAQGATASTNAPFDAAFCLPLADIQDADTLKAAHLKDLDADALFLAKTYGRGDDSWRRIDHDWLMAAEEFAIKLNEGVNNTSLVLAFELPHTKKVLLFVGDAQRGNWLSWDDGTFEIDDRTVKCKDLLERTVLYKVGHHGSHNATLNGERTASYPCLGWMARDGFAEEFTALIPANRDWAMGKSKPWNHPMPEIKEALVQKARGRVLQVDEGVPDRPDFVTKNEWAAFKKKMSVKETRLFVELTVTDEG